MNKSWILGGVEDSLTGSQVTRKVRTEVSIRQYGLVVVVRTRTTTHQGRMDLVILEAKAEAPLGIALRLERMPV